jgi:hypothetical protein
MDGAIQCEGHLRSTAWNCNNLCSMLMNGTSHVAIEHSKLQVITSQLLYHKPDDPKKFIIETLKTLQQQGAKPLLDEVDINTMFDMFDITQQGVLTKKQAYRAVKTVLGANHAVVKVHSVDEADDKTLTKKDFLEYVSSAMADAAPKLA